MGKVRQWPSENSRGEMMLAEVVDGKGSDHLHSVHNVHASRLEIDAVILDSRRGWIYVVEEKGWSSDWKPANDKTWLKAGGNEDRRSPYLQAWNAMIAIKEKLSQVPSLINHDGPHKGKLKFPIHPNLIFLSM